MTRLASSPSESASWSGESYLRDMFGDDPSGAFAQLRDDVEWIVPGDPAFGGGTHEGLEAVGAFAALVMRLFPEGLAIEKLREWPGENGAVLEVILFGTTAAGHEYRNAYAFVVERKNDRVHRIQEYADTSYAEEILRRSA